MIAHSLIIFDPSLSKRFRTGGNLKPCPYAMSKKPKKRNATKKKKRDLDHKLMNNDESQREPIRRQDKPPLKGLAIIGREIALRPV
jgi:hypothetical protein